MSKKAYSREQAIKLLRTDVTAWNVYYENIKKVNFGYYRADLRDVYLRRVDLRDADLRRADLRRADLSGVDLRDADLSCTDLNSANLRDADLGEVNLDDADLSGADLSGTNLMDANLTNALLAKANFADALFVATTINNVDLSTVKNLDQIRHLAPSEIGMSTLLKSNFNIPDVFLEGVGVPRKMIDYLPSFRANPIQYYSCFISYSTKDEAFTKRVFEGLKSEGIHVWYAPEKMKGGQLLHEQIDSAIRLHDKLLLVLSEHSMASDWVNTEIYKARKKEKRTGKRVLFPIAIIPHEQVVDWECFDADSGKDMARDIRQYYIPDFSNWKDHDMFQVEFEKLVRDLQSSEAAT